MSQVRHTGTLKTVPGAFATSRPRVREALVGCGTNQAEVVQRGGSEVAQAPMRAPKFLATARYHSQSPDAGMDAARRQAHTTIRTRKRYPPPRARKFDGRDTDRRRSHVSLRDFNTVGVDLPPSPAVLVVRCALVDVGIVAGS
ncbi:hypothetical protein B0H16DRAFT_1463059 [Mycena metata]|uniref:Uncharacterized protein n=1 Tax=Mycena metata TaxID=1033252 RepID=A0AAD7IJZ7_9AGAR|nr:hypothetical protein B0H16DRAFT_1463059 [Mycena metata]